MRPYSIALAGKGGTGKTTLAGMLIKYLIQKEKTPILAVDADANANFNDVLGVEINGTLGEARESMKKGSVPSGMTKDVFMSMKMQESVVETQHFDLIVMGRPEGAGCYCAANTLLTNFLDRLTDNYPYLIMDNEAGMEHISRLTTRNVDVMMLVSDGSVRGVTAAVRINDLAKSLHIGMGKSFLIINRAKTEPSEKILNIIQDAGIDYAGYLPADDTVYEFDMNGKATIDLPLNNKFVQAVFSIFDKQLNV
ncbi:MAG: AAA family ATPase [Candidatus Magnetomorum sp.]|nr:AAA family ATPase [Candidatus Magnetomorum sp.]